jgi:hypothetical protein
MGSMLLAPAPGRPPRTLPWRFISATSLWVSFCASSRSNRLLLSLLTSSTLGPRMLVILRARKGLVHA